jgi:hypothetical protein
MIEQHLGVVPADEVVLKDREKSGCGNECNEGAGKKLGKSVGETSVSRFT